MDLSDELQACFRDYESPAREQAWEDVKESLPSGSEVIGRVVARRPFGVFVDIGVGFPALVLVVKLKDAETTPYTSPYTSMAMYPDIGAEVEGRVYGFVDRDRQTGMTQLSRELMLDET